MDFTRKRNDHRRDKLYFGQYRHHQTRWAGNLWGGDGWRKSCSLSEEGLLCLGRKLGIKSAGKTTYRSKQNIPSVRTR
eukprot:1520715-Amphidinium_carterae.1